MLAVSEFRQDYLGNYTIPSHPLATSILTTSQTQAILSGGDGDKLVVTGGRLFFLQFCSLSEVGGSLLRLKMVKYVLNERLVEN